MGGWRRGRWCALVTLVLAGSSSAHPQPRPAASGTVGVEIETSLGVIHLAIDSAHAPVTAANFLRYVDGHYYDGGAFVRTVRADNQPTDAVRIAVVQAMANSARTSQEFPPIPLERTTVTGLHHRDGTLSMARNVPNSAKSSFFICIDEQPELDFGGHRNPDGQGFAAFGRVVSGMDVIHAIWRAPAAGQQLTPAVAIRAVRREERTSR
jgi:peptidyl-prolyl cis-trans isomerase A (cyclophilin A)